jgi:tRNA modification GTPase
MSVDFSVDQPIAALASPPGGAARGMVRISGTQVRHVLDYWFHPDDPERWNKARTATMHPGLLHLVEETGDLSISVQVLFWPHRRSYTGQPLIELHLPGSPCLLEAVLGEVYRRGARPARPGEFTLRAFLAGKLDLLQAEAVLGVIDAQDHQELQTALGQLAGGISHKLTLLRHDLLELLADLEAGLDFIEEDIEFISRQNLIDRLTEARALVSDLLAQAGERMQARVRFQVVLAGLPNAGKSTLFNRLAKAAKALVSPEQGTTRDFLTQTVHWNQLTFDLIDTAGWENAASGIAAAAQQQRVEQLQRADLLIWCTAEGLDQLDAQSDQKLFATASAQASTSIRLVTKTDLRPDSRPVHKIVAETAPDSLSQFQMVGVSVLAETGFDKLEQAIRHHLGSPPLRAGQWLGMTAARCQETLECVVRALDRAESAARQINTGDELIAVDLREALDQLGVILGVIYTDDILDRVFSKFCIGK